MNSNSRLRCRMAVVLAGVLASALPCFASVAGTFDRSYQVNGPVDLEVLTHSGDITIHNGPAGSVSVHGKIHVGNSWFGSERKADVQEIENNLPSGRAATAFILIMCMSKTSRSITRSRFPTAPRFARTAAAAIRTLRV